MKRFFTLAVAAALAAAFTTNAWSQGGQGGGGRAGGAGGAGASGSTATGGGAGGVRSGGATGTAGTANTAGTTGTPGAPGSQAPAASGFSNPTTNVGAAANAQLGAGQNQAAASLRAQGQLGAQERGFNQMNRAFFADPGARQQLGLNDNQFNQLNSAHQNAYNRYNQGVTGLGNTLTDQQRMQQLQQLQTQFNQDLSTTLDTTLTDPQIRQRYDQLNRQYQGPAAFNDPMIQQQLNITPQQQQALQRLQAGWNRSLTEMQRSNQADPGLSQQQWSTFRQQYQQRLNHILTPQQQQAWTQLMGQPYDFPMNAYVGGNAGAQQGNNTLQGTLNNNQGGQQQRIQSNAGTQTQPAQIPAAQRNNVTGQGTVR